MEQPEPTYYARTLNSHRVKWINQARMSLEKVVQMFIAGEPDAAEAKQLLAEVTELYHRQKALK